MNISILLIISLFFFLILLSVIGFSCFVLWVVLVPRNNNNEGNIDLPSAPVKDLNAYLDNLSAGFSDPGSLPITRPEEEELPDENPLEVA